MQRYLPIVAAGVITISLIYTLIRKRRSSRSENENPPVKEKQTYPKPRFRSNDPDNSSDFCTAENYERIKARIESLDVNKMLETIPDLSLRPFMSDNKIKDYLYIETEEELKKLVEDIVKFDKVIGLDIEQTNNDSYQGYNCLIQVSRSNNNYIIDTIALQSVLAPYLKSIFEKEDLIKVFYGGSSDLLWLNRDYGIFVVNYFDVYQASVFYDSKKDCSLVGLLKEYCGYTLNKSSKKNFQLSDWRVRPLTQDQLNYAALDSHYLIYLRNVLLEKIKKQKDHSKVVAFIKQMQNPCLKTYNLKPFSTESFSNFFKEKFGVYKKELKAKDQNTNLNISATEKKKIFLALCKLRDNIAREVDTSPEEVYPIKSLFDLTIELSDGSTIETVKEAIKKLEHSCRNHLNNYVLQIKDILQGQGLVQEIEFIEKESKSGKEKESEKNAKAERKKFFENQNTKKEIYEDCKLIAPDGDLLCYTNRKKIAWYISKGIGTLIQDEPPIIKLNFEPSNRGYSDMREMNIDKSLYVNQNRVTQCVICGQKQNLSRYHVVPLLYRQFFSLEMKAHRGHDVLLLCERCLEKANKESYKFRDELAKRYNVPLSSFEKPQNLKANVEGVKKGLLALRRVEGSIPKENKRKMKNYIRSLFNSIRDEEDMTNEFKEQVKRFKYREDGEVKINEEFVDYFTKMKNPKEVIKKSASAKEFKNTHGKLVLEKLKTPEELKEFIEEWRMFFIDVLDPQFLPHDWQIVMKKRIAERAAKKN